MTNLRRFDDPLIVSLREAATHAQETYGSAFIARTIREAIGVLTEPSPEPRDEVRAGDYVDVGGDPGLAVYPPHVLVLWQNKRTSLVPLGAVEKTSAAPAGIGSDDLTEARKLGPGGCSPNRPAEPV
jgi:hypothetical protein